MLYQAQGRDPEAGPLYKRSLAIAENALGPNHPDVAASLNNLALLHQAQGRYAEAEPLYKSSLAIWEKARGPDHPSVAAAHSDGHHAAMAIGFRNLDWRKTPALRYVESRLAQPCIALIRTIE